MTTASIFRFLVKQLESTGNNQGKYYWHEMSFFSKWVPSCSQTVICFDVPQALYLHLHKTLFLTQQTYQNNVYYLHTKIVEGILDLYDKAVWALRDVVREVESVLSLLHDTSDCFF